MGLRDRPTEPTCDTGDAITETERAVLESLCRDRRSFRVGLDIVRQGQTQAAAYLLVDGWACSYKTLPNGARQIANIHIPGDFLGLRSLLLQTSDHSVETITDAVVSRIATQELYAAVSGAPRLAAALLWSASRDEAMLLEHLSGIGRRDALERVAHFLLELGTRLMRVGLGTRAGYRCPLNQYILADTLGLTPVHVNRVLRKLREMGYVTVRAGDVVFDDFGGLVAFAGFEAAYLDQTSPLARIPFLSDRNP